MYCFSTHNSTSWLLNELALRLQLQWQRQRQRQLQIHIWSFCFVFCLYIVCHADAIKKQLQTEHDWMWTNANQEITFSKWFTNAKPQHTQQRSYTYSALVLTDCLINPIHWEFERSHFLRYICWNRKEILKFAIYLTNHVVHFELCHLRI